MVETLVRKMLTVALKPIHSLTWFFTRQAGLSPIFPRVNELTELHGKLQREQRRVHEAAALNPRELIFNIAFWPGRPQLTFSFAHQ